MLPLLYSLYTLGIGAPHETHTSVLDGAQEAMMLLRLAAMRYSYMRAVHIGILGWSLIAEATEQHAAAAAAVDQATVA